jgi:UDP-N-acetylmuramoylalanine--D-glutamate ligase
MSKPTVWIVGGVDKGNDYDALVALVDEKVKAIVCLGQDNLKIHSAFSKHVDLIVNTASMEEAVNLSHHLGAEGDAILLSPACASFDMFESYEDRGRQFKGAVRAI